MASNVTWKEDFVNPYGAFCVHYNAERKRTLQAADVIRERFQPQLEETKLAYEMVQHACQLQVRAALAFDPSLERASQILDIVNRCLHAMEGDYYQAIRGFILRKEDAPCVQPYISLEGFTTMANDIIKRARAEATLMAWEEYAASVNADWIASYSRPSDYFATSRAQANPLEIKNYETWGVLPEEFRENHGDPFLLSHAVRRQTEEQRRQEREATKKAPRFNVVSIPRFNVVSIPQDHRQ